MRTKLLATAVSALALVAIGIVPASASASTLTLMNAGAEPAEYLELYGGSVQMGPAQDCDEIALFGEVTQNASDPVTLNLEGELSGCWHYGRNEPVEYSNVGSYAPATLKPDGTGTLPIQLDEYRPAVGTCTRKGTLKLTWNAAGSISFQGLTQSSGSCPTETQISGSFSTVNSGGAAIDWVVTP